MIKRVIVYAAGGLGNQLFQLAAGHSIQSDREIVFEVGFSGTRNPKHLIRFLNSVPVDNRISIRSSKKFRALTQVLLSYLLRVSTKTSGAESLLIYRMLVSTVGSIYFSFYYNCFLVLSISKGVGFHELRTYKTNQMIIGYFQSYRYVDNEDGLSFLSKFPLRDKSSDWIKWSNRAAQEKPIMVHIRLGDYLSEDSFGIVTTNYISSALSKIISKNDFRPIWIFTDQTDLATKIFPEEFRARAVWVPEIDSDPMATLLVMRLGSAFVIANSTFSWWAAWQRNSLDAPIYCPRPWFSGLETPQDLIPDDWVQIDLISTELQ